MKLPHAQSAMLLAAYLSSVCLVTEVRGDERLDFGQHVAPLLAEHCLRCHSPNNSRGDVSLATFSDLKENEYVVAGDPEGSHLLDLVTASDGDPPAMPKDGRPLTDADVGVLRRWIAEGATWPDDVVIREKSKADASWWSLQPLRRSPGISTAEAPSPKNEAQTGEQANSIDEFIHAKLAEQNLSQNPPADRRDLIRRATYDLIGLPPTPDEVSDFVGDADPQAYEKLIDRLLASPHYGERWGRHWLDVVRFGESNGFERNVINNNVWPFRDYVIRSLNADKPFDQFIKEHIAGDVIGKDDPDVAVGTAFLVAGPYDDVGNQDAAQAAQIRANTLDEIIDATSQAFLGMTVACARCHDHKFDPITQQDYYGLYATFAGIRHGAVPLATTDAKAEREARLQPLQKRKAAIEAQQRQLEETKSADPAERDRLIAQLAEVNKQIAAVPGVPSVWIGRREAADAAGPFHVFLGGSPQKKGEPVVPASLSALTGDQQSDASKEQTATRRASYRLTASAPEAERRLALADWLAHPDNPLTPRVLANRLWHYHFGTGIVDTPSDFGYMGGRPTHPELLDFLAIKLQECGWRIKDMHRLIMTSQTYRQSSEYREDAAKVDGDARLLWRFPPRRLSAEEVRDTMLLVSGKLQKTASPGELVPDGGPGFRLYQFTQDNVCTYVPLDQHGSDTYRRAVYHQNARASVVDLMTEFDQPDCAFSIPKRAATTSPLQALTMLNHSFTLDMAAALADRIRSDAGDDVEAQIRRLYQLCYSRDPSADEVTDCQELIRQHGPAALCRVILNTSELIYVR